MMIDRIRADLQRDVFGPHGLDIFLVGETAFDGNRVVEVDHLTAINQVFVIRKIDSTIDQTTGIGRETIDFLAPHDTKIQTGSLLRRGGLLFRVEKAAVKEAFGNTVCVHGTFLRIDGALLAPNHPNLVIQRFKPEYDNNLNPVGKIWSNVASVVAHVYYVRGQTQYSGALLLEYTEYVVVVDYGVDVKVQDRVVIFGQTYKVDQINPTLLPGFLAFQVSTDLR